MGTDFKQTLWKAADKLRAQMDAAEYKHIVLGPIFLTLRQYLNSIKNLRLDRRSAPRPTPQQILTAVCDLWGPDSDILQTLDSDEAIFFRVIDHSVRVGSLRHDRDLQSQLLRHRSLSILFIINDVRALTREILRYIKT